MEQTNFILFLLTGSILFNGYLFLLLYRKKNNHLNNSETNNSFTEQREAFLRFVRNTNEKIYCYANFLHSELGGTLSSIKLQLSHIQYIEEAKNNPNPRLTEIINHLSDTIRSISRYSSRLIPGALLQAGLESTLQSYVIKTSLDTPVNMTFHHEGEFPSLDQDESIGIFFIITEYINPLIDNSSSNEIKIISKNDTNAFIIQIETLLNDLHIENYYTSINTQMLAIQAEIANASIELNNANRPSPILSIIYKNQPNVSI